MDYDLLIEELARYERDPLGFVYYAFPWGEEGSELFEMEGPEPWQVKVLQDIRDGLITLEEAIQIARTSGHGIGKSALVAWLIIWAISTFPDTRGVVTANTENQLKTKTWAEVAKWYRLFIGKELFKLTATALFSVDPEHEKTWRIDMVPWSEKNTEAFAGLHNQDKRILVVFDEGSAIPDIIWEVTEGALTDKPPTQIIWCVFGNPTRNVGRFRECFFDGKFAHRWNHEAIDSRTVSFTNRDQMAKWGLDYGEDSDFFRVRVRGMFPKMSVDSFISREEVLNAMEREMDPQGLHPIVLGVDVARFGDDASVVYPRQGHDARSRQPYIFYGLDTQQLAGKIADIFHNLNAAICMVDGTGVGGGVVDRLRVLRIPVIEVQFASKPDGFNLVDSQVKYANKRAEIIGAVRDALSEGLCLPKTVPGYTNNDGSIVDDFCTVTYQFNGRDEIQLETKKDMKARGAASSNLLDALACSYAYPVYKPSPADTYARALGMEEQPTIQPDYNPYEIKRIYNV